MAIEPQDRKALEELLGDRVAFDVPMARHTSLRVGGPADALARPGSAAELVALLALAHARGIAVLPLGAGFNLLVRDGGLRGIAVQLHHLRAIELDADGTLRCEAGVRHTTVSRFCAEAGRAGLEFAAGIPGTVGGWLAMNAGTREREMKDVVAAVTLADRQGTRELDADELRFRYRALELPAGALVVGARFRTTPDDPERIRAHVQAELDARRATQPVDRLSCGSVFENPPGDHAGRLIDAAGLKGSRAGDAEISELHANFIVNRGDARARDVLDLIERARDTVAATASIELRTEVRVVGEEA